MDLPWNDPILYGKTIAYLLRLVVAKTVTIHLYQNQAMKFLNINKSRVVHG